MGESYHSHKLRKKYLQHYNKLSFLDMISIVFQKENIASFLELQLDEKVSED